MVDMADMGGSMDAGAGASDVGSNMSGGSDMSGATANAPATTGDGGSGGGLLAMQVSDSMLNSSAGSNPYSSTDSIKAPTTEVSGSSTTPINSGAGAGGDIVRANPFGGEAGTSTKTIAKKEPTTAEKIGGQMKDISKKMDEDSKAAAAAGQPQYSPIGGSTYNALFGATNLMARQAPPPMQLPQIAAPPPVPQMAPVEPVQLPPPPAPAPMQLGAVSDVRAKKNIRDANAEMDSFLQKVYNNAISKGKK